MIVRSNTELYETCLTFLEAAVERKDEESAAYWSRIAFGYCDLGSTNKKQEREATNGTNSN
jgi:hypothetical protein